MNIFVGCSSRDTDNEFFINAAVTIGEFIVEHKHNLVFGGCKDGLMGKVYETVLESENSQIIAVQAKAYADFLNEIDVDEAYLTDTVNGRKDFYTKHSDILIFLPGGIGTIDEILTAIETKRNQEHNLPIIIINVDNYFNPLLQMLDTIYKEGFADEKNKECYYIASSIEEAKKYLSKLENQL